MTREELRLELLKLTYTHGRTSAEAVARAQELEGHVTAVEDTRPLEEPEPGLPKRGPGRPRKTDREPPLFG
jgi:hypothetical protein